MIDHQKVWITFLALIAFIALATSAYTSVGQQPIQPGSPDQIPAVELEMIQNVDAPETSAESGFGLVPVNPRDNSVWTQQQLTDESDNLIDDRTMSMLRSGNIDDLSDDSPSDLAETIRTRYPDGKVQILKNVVQDEMGNFYNHGVWRLYNQDGQVLAEGQFNQGLMEGQWQRWHPAGSEGLFSTEPFNQFQGPFHSFATFAHGKLDGVWIMYDKERQKILEIPYRQGKRHGSAIWWYPSSNKMRQASFRNGQLDGQLKEWDQQNKLVRNDEFISGKKIVRNTSFFRPKQKESETYFLDTELELEGDDNWWDAQPASFSTRGEAIQHGPASAWHDNGQLKMKGQYLYNHREGRFTWWHQNGQRSLAGAYDGGGKTGLWTWWHPNGMKRIQGNYQDDSESGSWTWWDEEGNLVSTESMTPAKSTGELLEPGTIKEIELDHLLESPLEPSATGPETLEEISPETPTFQENNRLIPQIGFEEDESDEILLEEPKRADK